jgi:hypothetical protein
VAELATLDQLAARTGSMPADAARAHALLTDASAVVRAYTGQYFERLAGVERLRARAETIHLPQRPVHDVTAVVDIAGNDRPFRWNGADTVYSNSPFTYGGWWGNCDQASRPEFGRPLLDVTYDHGYDIIPDDVVAVVCNMAARALGVDPTQAAVTSQTITNYSESFGPVGAAGPIGLFDAEKLVLDRYRRVASLAWSSFGT